MKTKPRFQVKIQRVIIITVCWTLFAVFSYVSQYFFIYDLISLNKLSGSYDFWLDFTGVLILGLFGGLAGGYMLVFKMGTKYRQKSFAFGIINSALLFVAAYLGLAIVGLFTMDFFYFIFHGNIDYAITKSFNNVLFNLKSPSFFTTMCVWAFLVSSTQFMLQVNDKFGQGNLWKFISGKYYQPSQEERIFMFLDLKSSTTVAEQIGSKKYFELLQAIYADITEPILNCQGEIYQYVGDEVVITWTIDKGIRNNNCLNCFFMIEETLVKKKEVYFKKYNTIPSFKAGLHIGEATVGEIGVIKKDIVFSGDVLNTTSRIQKECNKHNVNILISSDLLQQLNLNGDFRVTALGEFSLRGKDEKVSLNTVSHFKIKTPV
jgi:adenylate cyclase